MPQAPLTAYFSRLVLKRGYHLESTSKGVPLRRLEMECIGKCLLARRIVAQIAILT